jgi:hypothetical protein
MSVAVDAPVSEPRETLPAVADSTATNGLRRLARRARSLQRIRRSGTLSGGEHQRACNFGDFSDEKASGTGRPVLSRRNQSVGISRQLLRCCELQLLPDNGVCTDCVLHDLQSRTADPTRDGHGNCLGT